MAAEILPSERGPDPGKAPVSVSSPTIAHHWHEPAQGQVIKAMHQYFTEMGVTKELLLQRVEVKIGEVISAKIESLLKSKRFDELIVSAVATYVKSVRQLYDNESRGYGLNNHIRDLIQKELQATVLKEYCVSVTKVGSPGGG